MKFQILSHPISAFSHLEYLFSAQRSVDAGNDNGEDADGADDFEDEEDLLWGDGLNTAKLKTLGDPQRRIARVHPHWLRDQWFLKHLDKSIDILAKSCEIPASFLFLS